MALVRGLIVLLAFVVGAGCSAAGGSASTVSGSSPVTGEDGGVMTAVCIPGAATKLCEGATEVSCDANGSVTGRRDCAKDSQMCFPNVGCAVCNPSSSGCDGNTTRSCNAEGSAWVNGAACDAAKGEMCQPTTGTCESPCKAAEASNSYIGCEYWPTTTLNASLDAAFQFAVVVANPQTMPAQVTVTRGGAMVQQVSVAPGKTETIKLPYVAELKQKLRQQASVLLPKGAYKLVSNLPVTVYQFNPFDYKTPANCMEGFLGIGGNCSYSYSNDASLLLPTHVLTGDYMVMARPTLTNESPGLLGIKQVQSNPGFVTIVGTQATPVDVEIAFTSNVRASANGGIAVTAYRPGQVGRFKLGEGDVLQIVSDGATACTPTIYPPVNGTQSCESGPEYDLTGTLITASGKVAVYSGHDCDFVPSHVWACDHLEEALLPLQTWGKDFIVAATQQLRAGEPNVVRVVSAVEGNAVTFEPEVHPAVTLTKGQMIEFPVTESFRVVGTHALMVAQLLVGQNFTGSPPNGETWVGDPSLSLVVPSEQFRTSYTFVTPDTFVESYVNIIAPLGSMVMLDGTQLVSEFEPVGMSGMGVARVPMQGGQHQLEGQQGFGIVVYGFAPYTSYMYPGGLDLQPINVL